jgi:YidC/Oxa1 family membrane protein insertase
LKVSLKAVSNGAEVVRTYTFKRGSYVVDIDTRVKNLGTAAIEGFPYYQFQRHGQSPEGESALIQTFTGPVVYTEAGKFQKVSFEDVAKGKAEHAKEAKDGWIGLIQHHFFAAWLTRDPADASAREFYTRSVGKDEYTAGVILPAVKLNPGEEKTVSMRLYAGPQELEKIKTLAPGLDLVVDYGWLTVLAYPLFVVLNWLHNLVHNWGTAIILLTVLIKLVFYPLSAASYKSMAKMRKLAPRLQHLKERYGDDRQKLHEAMMKIYQEEKINPLGGCLPILVQIPVFIALYWVPAGRRGIAPGALRPVDHRPLGARSLLRPAHRHGHHLLHPGEAVALLARPGAAESHDGHAGDLLHHVPVLPSRPGALLADQQRAFHPPAVAHQQGHRIRSAAANDSKH